MAGVEGGLVLLPRFTTLCGAASFATAPLDITRVGSTQFNVWRGPIRVSSGTGTLTMFMEESLDCMTWSLGAATPQGVVIPENETKYFAYDVRLRWFRVRFELAGTNPMVSCWAEGLLREGDVWGTPYTPITAASDGLRPAGETPAGPPCKSKGTVRETWYTNETYEIPHGAVYRGKPTGMGYSDGRRWWTWAPPGYDVIDKWGKLIPWCSGGSSAGAGASPTESSPTVISGGDLLSPPPHPASPSVPMMPSSGLNWVWGANAGAGAGGLAFRNMAIPPLQLPQGP